MLFDGKKVLITGGAGFIGSNLAIRLVAEGAEVTILDSMLEEYGANIFNISSIKDKVIMNFSDMRDPNSLKFLVKNKDYIFNLAGQVSHQDSMENPFLDLDINVKSQLTLLETCKNFAPETIVVYSSTRQIYGKPQYLPVDERHPISPPDINGINKLTAENYHKLYSSVHGLRTVSLRLTNTYGPRQLIKNARQGFVGWFLNRTILGEPIKLFGSGEQLRDFNYVDDVVEAMVRSALSEKAYGNIYNLSGEKASLKEVAQILIECVGEGTIETVPFPPERAKIDIGDFYGDSHLFSGVTGWKPKVGIKIGLKNMVAYYLTNKRFYLDE